MKFAFYLHENHSYIIPESLLTAAPVQLALPEIALTAISKLPDFQQPPKNDDFLPSQELEQFLQGKKLLLAELPFPIELIHNHYQNGYIAYHKAIIAKRYTYTCMRCGNDAKHLFAAHQCAKCDDFCIYCRHCIAMGKIAQCTPLLTWTGLQSQYQKRDRILEWQGQLSQSQLQASKRIVAATLQPETLLIWAVCIANNDYINKNVKNSIQFLHGPHQYLFA